MTISDDALSAALQMEVKKDGLSQMQSGEWVLKLKVHAEDMPTDLMTASMGTRYVAVLVEVGEDEQPVKKEEKLKQRSLAQKAGILCGDNQFQLFLLSFGRELWHSIDADNGTDTAAEFVRLFCRVSSRAAFDTDPIAGERFERLLTDYEAWKRCIEPAA